MLKIITKKQQEEIEKIKKENEFLSKGWRAMNIALDYQRGIVAILETANMKEIEIDNRLLYTTEKEIEVQQTLNNTTKIRIKQRSRDNETI